MTATISNRQRRVRLDLPALRKRAEAVLEKLRCKDKDIGIALVGDRAMRSLNRQFRGEGDTTDVLSFPFQDAEYGDFGPGAGMPNIPAGYLGEVVISVDEAKRQADEAGEALEAAMDRLLVHGILHLRGLDHSTAREAARMRQSERRLLAALETLRGG